MPRSRVYALRLLSYSDMVQLCNMRPHSDCESANLYITPQPHKLDTDAVLQKFALRSCKSLMHKWSKSILEHAQTSTLSTVSSAKTPEISTFSRLSQSPHHYFPPSSFSLSCSKSMVDKGNLHNKWSMEISSTFHWQNETQQKVFQLSTFEICLLSAETRLSNLLCNILVIVRCMNKFQY